MTTPDGPPPIPPEDLDPTGIMTEPGTAISDDPGDEDVNAEPTQD